jgi:hypothetical protein
MPCNAAPYVPIRSHSTDQRQREIADALGELAASELSRSRGNSQDTTQGPSGTTAQERLVGAG